MKTPISVEPIVTKGKEQLKIWKNGKKIVIDAPIKPFFYTLKEYDIPSAINVTKVTKRALSDYQWKTFYKYEFKTRSDLVDARNKLNKNKIDRAFEANVPFVIRNRIENPEIYTEFQHSKEVKFHFLDIEQYTPSDKLFPTYDDKITSISFAENDKKIRTIYLESIDSRDSDLLEMYKDMFNEPDVIVLYNKTYDMPVILERCKRNNIDTRTFSKSNEEPFIGGKHGVTIDGTIVYDVYDSTDADQILTGNVPSKTLKHVSNFYKFQTDIEVVDFDEVDAVALIGTKKLIDYNKDDVRRLIYLFNIYWDEISYKTNDLKLPLNETVDLSVTDLGLVVLGDLYKEHDIISDGDNYTRYPEIFQREKSTDEKNYQGALSFIIRKGLFEPVYKADYGSMYPTIMSEFNFSPDTSSIIKYDPYTEDGFKIEEKEDHYIYYIPDNQIKKNVIIKVLKKKGFLSRAIKRFLDERSVLKKKARETGKRRDKARSNIPKVKANGGIYGNMGSARHPFGFIPAAIGTTGIGRICAQLLIDVLEKLYPNSTIEVDTDGVYFSAEDVNEERILYYFNKAIEERFGRKLNLDIDIDSYDKGFFHKAKNYILKKGDNIILHGASMKASKMCPMERKFIQEVAKAKLDDKPVDGIIDRYKQNIKDFPLRDLAMQVRLGMKLRQYKNQKSISVRIALQALKYFKINPEVGNEYHYIKVGNGYELYQLTKKHNVDYKYYLKKIDKIIKRMELDYRKATDISSFIDNNGSSWNSAKKQQKPKPKKTKSTNIQDFF